MSEQIIRVLFHSGTYNGHLTILAAGLATIDVLLRDDNYQKIQDNTKKLRLSLENVLRYYQIPVQTIGMGSIFSVVLTTDTVNDYRDLQKANIELRKELDYHLLGLGVYQNH